MYGCAYTSWATSTHTPEYPGYVRVIGNGDLIVGGFPASVPATAGVHFSVTYVTDSSEW